MKYSDRDRIYLSVDDYIRRTEEIKDEDKKFVREFMDKFNLFDEDGDNSVFVLPTEEFYYLIVTVISEYESFLSRYPRTIKSKF